MKVDKAPEKIILSADRDTKELYTEWVTRDLTDNIKIEYTRTDAFIEKAQLFLIDKLKEIPMGSGKMKIKAECSLDKFIEDFKNYMEGE
jgi:hypothetical protein